MELSLEFKQRVLDAAIAQRANYTGRDASFASTIEINPAQWSQLKAGVVIERLLSNSAWINMARILGVGKREKVWNTARTAVYDNLEGSMSFCKEFSKAMMMVDDCGIGKTWCAKHIAKTMTDTFYIDCSQAPQRLQFIRLIAKTIGLDITGKSAAQLKANIKHYLSMLDRPLMILDEAGDLDYAAFVVIKELWNGTDGYCGWYMLGADGLRNKIELGISYKKVGFAEIFSRFSDEFVRVTPDDLAHRKAFRMQLLTQVAEANVENKKIIPAMVRKCLDKESTLRHLDTLIKMTA